MPAVTPYGLCVALAAALAILEFHRENKSTALEAKVADLSLLLIPSALLGARILYVLLRLEFYGMIGMEHALYLTEGGYLLYGAVLAGMLALFLYARRSQIPVSQLYDALACPMMLCIAACRLGEGFAGEGLGNWLDSDSAVPFPFVLTNYYGEKQWSVFLLEAVVALAIFCFALGRKEHRFLFCISLYAACQIVLESLRMDSVLKIGFVRVSQVISGLALLAIVLYGRLTRKQKKDAVREAVLIGAGAGCVGFLEWAIEKTQVSNLVIYLVMVLAVAVMAACALNAAYGRRKTS